MMTLKKYLSLAILLGAFATFAIRAQSQQSGPTSKEWLINLPSAPLKLGLSSESNSIKLESRSTGHIVSFWLGCVVQEKDDFSVVEVLKERRINLPGAYDRGGADLTLIFMPVSDFESHKNRCEQMKARVSAVEVEFSDGAVWKAKR